jgi:hypothetical protein
MKSKLLRNFNPRNNRFFTVVKLLILVNANIGVNYYEERFVILGCSLIGQRVLSLTNLLSLT